MTFEERKILATYDYFDDGDISTERLLAMVANDCDCEIDEVVNVLMKYNED